MTTDTPLNLNKPTMDLADLRLQPAESITASTFAKELQEDSLLSHIDYLSKELAASKAEVAEMRVALGDDGRRTHKEILELATKASEWRTWKQKYINLRNAHIAEGQDPAGTIWEHADKLQKELKASKAEVDRLNGLLNDLLILTEKQYWNSTNYKQIKAAHNAYK